VILKNQTPYYETELGCAYLGDSLDLLRRLPDERVDLIFTSPPYALHFKKEYGNVDKTEYVDWFLNFAKELYRVLKPEGSFFLNIGGSYRKGSPIRSLYQFRLLISLVDEIGFFLAQELFWHNPAKLPVPAQWVTVTRQRVKDSVEYIFWLSKSERPRASNLGVLVPYSKDMERLIEKGYRAKERPSGHKITNKFRRNHGGAIPSNLIECGNNSANDSYIRSCQQAGIKPHPARFPWNLPDFAIKLTTDEGDVVMDPFAGSNVTGAVAESLKRRWIAFEIEEKYLKGSKFRFWSKQEDEEQAGKDPNQASLFPEQEKQTNMFG
jgi:site-specific DNA-methyltransferase (cytosine-N4-specific)